MTRDLLIMLIGLAQLWGIWRIQRPFATARQAYWGGLSLLAIIVALTVLFFLVVFDRRLI